MGLFDSIFGGTKTDLGIPDFRTTNIDTKRPGQIQVTDDLTSLLSQILQGGGRQAGFEGQLSAGPSGLETQSFQSISDLLNPQGQAQQFAQRSLTPFDPQTSVDRFNEFQLPFAQRNQEESRRQLLERFAGTGGFDSGATLRAANRQETDFNLGLQSQLGQQLNTDERFGLDKNLAGLNALLGIQTQGLTGGGVQRGIEQQGLDRILNNFLRGQQADPLLGLTGTALASDTFTPFVQQSRTEVGPSALSQISQLLSGGGDFAKGGGIKGLFGI